MGGAAREMWALDLEHDSNSSNEAQSEPWRYSVRRNPSPGRERTEAGLAEGDQCLDLLSCN